MGVLDNPAGVLSGGTKNVTTAGTAVQLTSTRTPCRSLGVTARPGNTGVVYVGGSGVLATAGSEVGVGLAAGGSVSLDVADVSMVYIDSTVNSEGVSFAYLAQ